MEQIPVWLYVLIVLGGVGGYHWYKVGRHGGAAGYQKHQFKLKEGENLLHAFAGSYVIDTNLKKDVGLALVGMQRVGKAVMIGITDKNHLILAHDDKKDGAIRLQRDDVSSIHKTKEGNAFSRPHVEIELRDGGKIKLTVAPSGLEPLLAWAS